MLPDKLLNSFLSTFNIEYSFSTSYPICDEQNILITFKNVTMQYKSKLIHVIYSWLIQLTACESLRKILP